MSAPDEIQGLKSIADDICRLLSFALSKDVTWPSLEIVNSKGQVVRTEVRMISSRSHGRGNPAVIDNYEQGSLKRFVETSTQICARNPDWWRKTLILYHEVQMMGTFLELTIVPLYILIDRISEVVLTGEKFKPQIGPQFNKQLQDQGFVDELNAVLAKLDGWNQERTKSVIEMIKGWNAHPTLSKKVLMACEALGIPQPNETLIKPRNRLLHDWEFDTSKSDIVAHWKELEFLILIMLLVMLEYKDTFYLLRLGGERKRLTDACKSNAALT